MGYQQDSYQNNADGSNEHDQLRPQSRSVPPASPFDAVHHHQEPGAEIDAVDRGLHSVTQLRLNCKPNLISLFFNGPHFFPVVSKNHFPVVIYFFQSLAKITFSSRYLYFHPSDHPNTLTTIPRD
jgi:hypothetical protein